MSACHVLPRALLTRTLTATLTSGLLALGLVAATSASAEAARPWPGGRITYVDKTKDSKAVRTAVRAWNHSGVRVRFVKVKKPSRAALVIRNSKNVPSGCGSGRATLGYVPGGRAFVNILHGTDAGGQGCALPGQTLVLAHELGHVLGLTHNDSTCSVMNSSRSTGSPPPALSPGHPTAPGPAALSVVRGAEPAVPGWLGTWGYGVPGLEVHATAGTCTAVPGDRSTQVAVDLWDVPVGSSQQVYVPSLPAGTHCLSVWQFDQGNNYALTPATVTVQVG